MPDRKPIARRAAPSRPVGVVFREPEQQAAVVRALLRMAGLPPCPGREGGRVLVTLVAPPPDLSPRQRSLVQFAGAICGLVAIEDALEEMDLSDLGTVRELRALISAMAAGPEAVATWLGRNAEA